MEIPLSIIVIGASGDLARKKIFPALFSLYCRNLLPTGTIKTINKINVVCVTSNPKSPYGYEFDRHKFLNELKKNLSVPVFDVIGGE